MSRRKKSPHSKRKSTVRPTPKVLTDAEQDEELIADTTRIFTCFTTLTHDFLHQCVDQIDRVECDIDYNRLAIQMWTGGPGRADDLVAVLSDFVALRERYHAALSALRPRLDELLAIPTHDHLEPADRWHELIRKQVLSSTPEPT